MFLSTQSVSRPKRDSIYSFMRHSGPLGCITTEIFSENHCCLKRRFSENLDSTVSTGQLEQKMTLLRIFQLFSDTQNSWKILKNQNNGTLPGIYQPSGWVHPCVHRPQLQQQTPDSETHRASTFPRRPNLASLPEVT